MLKKILLAVSSLAILAAASAANAGGPPVYSVYPATATIKVKGTEYLQAGASKIVSGSANNQKLIRLAMGNDINTPFPNEKNLVLGYVPYGPFYSCEAQLVVWNKLTNTAVGVLGFVNSCHGTSFQTSKPASLKSGTRTDLETTYVRLENTSDNCSSLNQSLLSGDIYAQGLLTRKVLTGGTDTGTSFKFTRFVGDAYDRSDDTALTVVDGSISVNFTKKLGTTSQELYEECDE
ncbi:hypothetical protein [Stenotrophobium rhamnosiphilum]|uniref:Uncharacterized protein n=1 Tax=Stenotrophobium rhamnosiphilum TaxID=2029166 RepID=A0A2T5MF13_9GAMM|nr:hypothetical protein [Stenotrophobium rhamnosiphilum]PTU31156.1 hypothetical protein CJD38_12780 [Stenotrophobium rhamnosiphilum]